MDIQHGDQKTNVDEIRFEIKFFKTACTAYTICNNERKVNTELYGAVYFTSPEIMKHQYDVCCVKAIMVVIAKQ
jgi:hypothetical protein